MTDPTSYPNAGRLHRERMAFERDFTQLPNVWLRDKGLSFKARGLLALLMTHEVGFEVTLQSLAASSMADGVDAVRTGVSELERSGYLHRVKERRKGKFGGYLWVLQDPFKLGMQPEQPALFPVDNPPAPRGINRVGKSNDGGLTASENPTTIEDHLKKISSTSATLDAPVENFGAVVWPDDRCAGNWRDGQHELSEHGFCRHCHIRPSVRSAS